MPLRARRPGPRTPSWSPAGPWRRRRSARGVLTPAVATPPSSPPPNPRRRGGPASPRRKAVTSISPIEAPRGHVVRQRSEGGSFRFRAITITVGHCAVDVHPMIPLLSSSGGRKWLCNGMAGSSRHHCIRGLPRAASPARRGRRGGARKLLRGPRRRAGRRAGGAAVRSRPSPPRGGAGRRAGRAAQASVRSSQDGSSPRERHIMNLIESRHRATERAGAGRIRVAGGGCGRRSWRWRAASCSLPWTVMKFGPRRRQHRHPSELGSGQGKCGPRGRHDHLRLRPSSPRPDDHLDRQPARAEQHHGAETITGPAAGVTVSGGGRAGCSRSTGVSPRRSRG